MILCCHQYALDYSLDYAGELPQVAGYAGELDSGPQAADQRFYRGKLQAMRYFFRYELPEIGVWAKLLLELDDTTYEMAADWFQPGSARPRHSQRPGKKLIQECTACSSLTPAAAI